MLNNIAALYGTGVVAGDYESISTVTVGAGGSGAITFNSIPQTYKHLQLRSICQQQSTGGYVSMTMTGGTFAYRHYLLGNGASASAGADTTNAPGIASTETSSLSGAFGVTVLDILDYTNVNKNKTIRSLFGKDYNQIGNTGLVGLFSGLYTSSSAITEITITPVTNNIAQYSSFALYGIK